MTLFQQSLMDRSSGVAWELREEAGNSYYFTRLLYADKSDLVFTETISLQGEAGLRAVCVHFR